MGALSCDASGACIDTSMIPIGSATLTPGQISTLNPVSDLPLQTFNAFDTSVMSQLPAAPAAVADSGIPTTWYLGLAAAVGVILVAAVFGGGKH